MSAPLRLTRVASAPLLLALVLFAASPPAHAAGARIERPGTDATPPAATAPPPPPFVFAPQGGSRIVDPANPMRETAPGIYEGIVPVQLPDGTWLVHLDERFMQFSVARLAAGGGFGHACVSGLDGLARWRAATTAGAPAPARAGAVQPKVTTPGGTVVTKWEVQ